MTKGEDKAFSSADFVGQCLVDGERTLSFQKAINEVVKKNDTVLDLGTGSGIMALLAARAGAKKVFAVEFDSFIAEIAKKNINTNNLEGKVEILVSDAREHNFSKDIKFNIVISEMLTTGMVDEPQVQAINNLHKRQLVNDSTVFIPSRQDTYISLVNADFEMFGFKIPMILHLWKWHKWSNMKITHITDKLVLNSLYFDKQNQEEFKVTVSFRVKKDGIINSLHLTSRTFLTDKIFLDDTEALNAPMLVPIPEKFVKKEDELKMEINYVFGGGYGNFHAKFLE